MKLFSILIALPAIGSSTAIAGALTPASTFGQSYNDQFRLGTGSVGLMVKGSGTNTMYMLEADPTTGALLTSPVGAHTTSLLYRSSYTTTPVTTSAYVQVTAATTAPITQLYDFDSSGSGVIIAVGAAGSEVPVIYAPPGGSDPGWPVTIPTGSRIAIKALDTNATTGQIILTGIQ